MKKDELVAQFSRLRDTSNPIGLSDEGLKILLHIEKKRQEKQGKLVDYFVLNFKELDGFLNKLLADKNIPKEGSRRVLAIVSTRDDGPRHYTAIDFKLTAKKNQCFILDAANAIEFGPIYTKLTQRPELIDTFWAKNIGTGGLQRDCVSCPVHSYYHALVAPHSDLYDYLTGVANDGRFLVAKGAVAWSRLPPEFVLLAEKDWWLTGYKEQHEKISQFADFGEEKMTNGQTFNEFFKEYLEETVSPAQRLFATLREQGTDFVNGASEAELNAILDAPNEVQPLVNSKLEREKLTQVLKDLKKILSQHHQSNTDSNKEKSWSVITPQAWANKSETKEEKVESFDLKIRRSDSDNVIMQKIHQAVSIFEREESASFDDAMSELIPMLQKASETLTTNNESLAKALRDFVETLMPENSSQNKPVLK